MNSGHNIHKVSAPGAEQQGGTAVNKSNLYKSLGMGVAACGLGAMLLRPRKSRRVKSAVGKTLRTMSELADSISDAMGW